MNFILVCAPTQGRIDYAILTGEEISLTVVQERTAHSGVFPVKPVIPNRVIEQNGLIEVEGVHTTSGRRAIARWNPDILPGGDRHIGTLDIED